MRSSLESEKRGRGGGGGGEDIVGEGCDRRCSSGGSIPNLGLLTSSPVLAPSAASDSGSIGMLNLLVCSAIL